LVQRYGRTQQELDCRDLLAGSRDAPAVVPLKVKGVLGFDVGIDRLQRDRLFTLEPFLLDYAERGKAVAV